MRSESTAERTFADAARREQIVRCAIALIAEIGYPQASLAKIAERAGISKSVVLYHFRGKDELVSEIVTTVFGRSAALMVPRIAAAATPTERLVAYIESNGEFLDAHRTDAIALHEISLGYRDASGRRFDQSVQASVERDGIPPELALLDPTVIFADGLRTGEFHSTAGAEILRNVLRACLDGAVSELSRDVHYDVLAHAQTVKDLFLTTIGGSR